MEVPKARAEEFFKVIPELQKPVPPSDRAKKVSTEPSYSKTKKTVVVASNPPPSQVVINGVVQVFPPLVVLTKGVK